MAAMAAMAAAMSYLRPAVHYDDRAALQLNHHVSGPGGDGGVVVVSSSGMSATVVRASVILVRVAARLLW